MDLSFEVREIKITWLFCVPESVSHFRLASDLRVVCFSVMPSEVSKQVLIPLNTYNSDWIFRI